MHAMKQARWMPSEDGGMIPIGMRTSDLSKAEMGELMELMAAPWSQLLSVTFQRVRNDERAHNLDRLEREL